MALKKTISETSQIRWMIRRDYPEVLQIEDQWCLYPWSDDDLVLTLKARNCIGTVIEDMGMIRGFMIYGLYPGYLELINIAVDGKYRRCGLGRMMIDRMLDKLSQQRRTSIAVTVGERNVAAQCFFGSQGFSAVGVRKVRDKNGSETSYRMVYSLDDRNCQWGSKIEETVDSGVD